jgi:hypothetical protein
MPDCKNPHSISYQILLWTLLGYVHLYSRLLLFFCFYYCFLFLFAVCGDYDATHRTQDRFLTQISLRSGNVFTVMLALQGLILTALIKYFSVPCVQTPVSRPLAIGLLFGAPLASVLRNKVKSAIRIVFVSWIAQITDLCCVCLDFEKML